MKQTVVEWLQSLNEIVDLNDEDFKKAIKMEIEQMQDACDDAYKKGKHDAYLWYREQLKKKQ